MAQGWLAQGRGEGPSSELHEAATGSGSTLVSAAARPLAEIDKPADLGAGARPRSGQDRADSEGRALPPGGRGPPGPDRADAGVPPTAILILTDGETTDGESLADAAKFAGRKGVPLYAIGLGDPEARPRPRAERAARRRRRLRRRPRPVPAEADLEGLRRPGRHGPALGDATRRSADPKAAQAPGDDPRPRPARRPAEADRDPAPPKRRPARSPTSSRSSARPRELSGGQQPRSRRRINVREETLKVLFVDNEPRYEFRYLKNFLSAREDDRPEGRPARSPTPSYSPTRTSTPCRPSPSPEGRAVRLRRHPPGRRRPGAT